MFLGQSKCEVFLERLKYYKSRYKENWASFKKKYMAIPRRIKLIILSILVLAIVGVISFLMRDKPELIEELASKTFNFSVEKELKPFASYFPSVGEDHLLKKIIVNLKQSEDYPEAMGMFEIFLNVKSAFMLQTIKDKEYLIQDVLQRELESFNYESLSKPQAKKMLKAILKNKVNRALNKRLVKRLYFKTYVIQK